MEAELFHGPNTAPTSRRGQIARDAGTIFKDRTAAADLAIEVARRNLRNKLRLAYRIPYHEWEAALATGDAAIGDLLMNYRLKHEPAPSPARAAYLAETGRQPLSFASAPSRPRLPR